MDTIDALVAEQDRLEAILETLDSRAWSAASAAAGWTISDVVLHLAQSEEAVVATVTAMGPVSRDRWAQTGETTDDAMERAVRAERGDSDAVFDRWKAARRASVDALRHADPDQHFAWAAAPLKPRTLATTRLAEHWAHALDIAEPLAIPLPDTDRLQHIAWLGYSTLPYGFQLAGDSPHDVRAELVGPSGDAWVFGPAEADSAIRGDAGAFCRVGAQRLTPDESGLETTGPHGAAALRVLRNYAG